MEGALIARSVPSLSVVICTRDRGRAAVDTVRSVLASVDVDLEVLVVDQSAGSETSDALAGVRDGRLIVKRSSTVGLSRARNLGLAAASFPIVAMTDDDCEVDPHWAARMVAAFERDTRIALVFGDVLPGPHDPSIGFIPGYRCRRPFVAQGLAQKMHAEGIGACMAMRRDVALALGGFDPALGAGTAAMAGEEVDLTIRVLAAGYAVHETPEPRVVHLGFRRFDDARRLAAGYWMGAGYALGKHLPRLWVLKHLTQLALRTIGGRSHTAERVGAKGIQRARIVAFARGLWMGWRGSVASHPVPEPAHEPSDKERSHERR